MDKQNINLTNSEWRILECLWSRSPLGVMELVRELSERVGWAKSTTITLLKRMEAKGLVVNKPDGKAKSYYPTVRREDAALNETQSFINKVYQGSVGLTLSAIVRQQKLSREEIDQLYAILKQAEGERKNE